MLGQAADVIELTTAELTSLLLPDDTVLIGQSTAEPPRLVAWLLEAAEMVPGLTAFCGYTLSDAWQNIGSAGPHIRTYAAHGVFRSLMKRGGVEVLPLHMSAIEQHLRSARLAADVVLLQVGPMDAEGYYSFGPTVDYVSVAVEQARVVLVEVNPDMPQTHNSRRLHASRVTRAIESKQDLASSPARAASEVEKAVARNVVDLIASGSTIQLGAGALAEAVAEQLQDRRNLSVRSGLVGDWLVDLYSSGAMRSGEASTVTSMALGTRRLYDLVDRNPAIRFESSNELVCADALVGCEQYVSVNSAIEVDLSGQVNSEVIGGRYVGAVGGQVDFFRATRVAKEGLAVVALASTHATGESRIVDKLQGPVTSLKSDVDFVVTEWGVADLRVASFTERIRLLRGIAAPEHR